MEMSYSIFYHQILALFQENNEKIVSVLME